MEYNIYGKISLLVIEGSDKIRYEYGESTVYFTGNSVIVGVHETGVHYVYDLKDVDSFKPERSDV